MTTKNINLLATLKVIFFFHCYFDQCQTAWSSKGSFSSQNGDRGTFWEKLLLSQSITTTRYDLFWCASQRVQPTVPTFFWLSYTDQSNNTQIMRAGNNNDSIRIINNNNNNNIYDNNRSNCITCMEGYHLHNRLLVWSIRNFSKNMRISNIAKYTVKSRFPGKKRHP